MPSTYSPLKVELMATGENSGTWGTITNTNLGTALEEAIVGLATANFASDANLTLTLTNTNATQIARHFVLNVTSGVSLTVTRDLIVPAIEKPYLVQNNTTGGQSIVIKNTTGTGITVPNGREVFVYNDGTNVVSAIDHIPDLSATTATFTNVSVGDGSASVPSITNTGDTNTGLFFPADDTIAFTEGGVEAMRIDSSGNVGIGTSSPGGDASNRALTLNAAVSSNLFFAAAGTNYGFLRGESATLQVGTLANIPMQIVTNSTERMRIDSSGNVGIGTGSPTEKLDVTGNIKASGSITATSASISGALTLGSALPVASGGTGASTAAQARTNLGLGDMATQTSSSVAITGGSISGVYTLTAANVNGTVALANGGTGASTAATARTNLGLGTMATQNDTAVAITGGSLSGVTATNPTVTNYVESVVAIGTVTSSHTISLTNGTVQTATLTASTACTFTMPTATAGKSFVFLLKQAATTGNGTATFSGVKWSSFGTPTITATANRMDIFTFVADGTNWYGSFTQGYTL